MTPVRAIANSEEKRLVRLPIDRAPARPAILAALLLGAASAAAQEQPNGGGTDETAIAADGAPDANPEQAAPAEKFDIWEFRVLGTSVLPRKQVEATLYSHLGPQKT